MAIMLYLLRLSISAVRVCVAVSVGSYGLSLSDYFGVIVVVGPWNKCALEAGAYSR